MFPDVIKYEFPTLKNIFSKYSEASVDLLSERSQTKYFEEYFGKIKAQTIVIEKEYIDKDFTEDYAAFYVRCFHEYERKCTRLHFFKNEFSVEQFKNLISGLDIPLNSSQLQENYLGFIVIKHLPQTIIGRTCLITYDGDSKRNYPIIREYPVSLFGIRLSINSLAFQEQDHVVAACATSALWSVFQGTGMIFHHSIPTPARITRIATESSFTTHRALPNSGLNLEQMAQAIKSVELEPFPKTVSDEFILKTTVYAYLKARIPFIFGLILVEKHQRSNNWIIKGRHAVALTGFHLENTFRTINLQNEESSEIIKFKCKALSINKFYVHDDQVGPFSRMIFDEVRVTVEDQGESMSLSINWVDKNGQYGNVRAIPETLLIPLYHKIRIPFSLIQDSIIRFNAILNLLQDSGFIEPNVDLIWDIYLSTIEEYKNDVFLNNNISGALKEKILLENLPKYLWIATLDLSNKKFIEIIFDATDIDQGHFLTNIFIYDEDTGILLQEILRNESFNVYKNKSEWKIIQWFRNNN